MAGPRSISSSTRVAAPAGSGKYSKGKSKQRKGSKQKGSKKGAPPLPTWDHDNSSADDEPTAAAATTTTTATATAATTATATTATTAARKKRPRATVRFAESVGPDGDGVQKASTLKRQRPVTSESGGGDDDQGSSSGGDGSEGEEAKGADEEGDDDAAGEGNSAHTDAASAGGMGDVMARILGQKLDNRIQAPVLAKRKTKAMKEMESAGAKRSETRGKSAARRANMTQQFVIPDHTTADYERQMKKIATRGVVALFNAISKRQNEGDSKSASGAGKSATVKGASKHAFLDMLKTGVKPGAAAAGAGEGGDGKQGGRSARGGAAGAGAGWDKDEGEQKEERSWSVLKEDYMMGASSMKNWDQESAESDANAVGGGDSMSDDDSD